MSLSNLSNHRSFTYKLEQPERPAESFIIHGPFHRCLDLFFQRCRWEAKGITTPPSTVASRSNSEKTMSCAPTEGVEVDFILRISKFLMLNLVLRFFRIQLTNKRMRLVKVCLILLMEEIRPNATSWYGTYPHYLQGFIHVRWCRISSINSISSPYQYIHEKKLNTTTFLHVSVQWEVSHLHLSCFRPSNKVTDGLPIFSKLKGQNQPRLTGTS